ncbi:MAG: Lrp/AsnC family transcriptional regulator [Gammaproteobacteria bacterium]|nr:MAG: Lrp/AsnC family transcriptional regulator [Gammaproteobacteria bacterium]
MDKLDARILELLQSDGALTAAEIAERIGLSKAFVTLKTGNHSEAWFEKFVRAVRDIPEVTEIHRMSGDVDYLIRIVVPDIDAYDAVYKRLISAVEFQDVSASFALETIKYTTALPLDYLKLD